MQYTLIGLEIHTGPILLQGMDCGGGFFAFLIWLLTAAFGGYKSARAVVMVWHYAVFSVV